MEHKIAVLSDIHGNMTALEAVIEDSKHENVTDYWFIGDLIMPGPGASDLLALIRTLPNAVFIKGNWEDCFLEVLNKDIDLDNPTDVYISKLAKYQFQNLNHDDIEFIKQFPMHLTKNLNGLEVGLSHNLPQKNFGSELFPTQDQKNFSHLFKNNKCDVAIYAHSHHQIMRYGCDGQLILNPGSIGQPYFKWEKLRSDLRAQYAIFEVDKQGIPNIIFKKVGYDIKKEIKRAKEKNIPYIDLYIELLETGRTHTHNKEFLRKINHDHQYVDEVLEFLNEIN